MTPEESTARRREAARKGAATRKANAERKWQEWNERGRYEAYVDGYLQTLARHGKVVIAPPQGAAHIRTNVIEETVLIVGHLRVSLARVTFTPTEGLHPAAMAAALRHVADFLAHFRFGDWNGWTKTYDEDMAECYSTRLGLHLRDDDETPLLDVDPITAVLQV